MNVSLSILVIGTGSVAGRLVGDLAQQMVGAASIIDILASDNVDSIRRAQGLKRDAEDSRKTSEPRIRVRTIKTERPFIYDFVIVCRGATLPDFATIRQIWTENTGLINDTFSITGKDWNIREFKVKKTDRNDDHEKLWKQFKKHVEESKDLKISPLRMLKFFTTRRVLSTGVDDTVNITLEVWKNVLNHSGRIRHLIWVSNPTDLGLMDCYQQMKTALNKATRKQKMENDNSCNLQKMMPNCVGSGIVLDTIRARSFFAEEEVANPSAIQGAVCGQHGALSVIFYTVFKSVAGPSRAATGRFIENYIETFLKNSNEIETERGELLIKLLGNENYRSESDSIDISNSKQKATRSNDPLQFEEAERKRREVERKLKEVDAENAALGQKILSGKPIHVRYLLEPLINNLFHTTASATEQSVVELIKAITSSSFNAYICCESMCRYSDLFVHRATKKEKEKDEKRFKLHIKKVYGKEKSEDLNFLKRMMNVEIPFGFYGPPDRRKKLRLPLVDNLEEIVVRNGSVNDQNFKRLHNKLVVNLELAFVKNLQLLNEFIRR